MDTPHLLTYEIPNVEDQLAYGGPQNVRLNGQSIEGVQNITIEHNVGDFSVVTIRIGGLRVEVTEKK